MNRYLVPTNAKKSLLIFNMFRPIDLIILGTGIGITVVLLLVLGNAATWILLLACIPMFIGAFLVFPIPNYHNTLVALQCMYNFYNERRNYKWRGWCIKNEFK